MKKFDKELLLSAVKDAFLNDEYADYSIGHGWVMNRNDDVESWEDEGISIFDDKENIICCYCVESFCDSEEEWFFNKGEVIEKMVDYVYEEQLSFIEDYKHIADSYFPEDLRSELDGGEMTKEEIVDNAISEISYILGDWADNNSDDTPMYLEEDWWDVAVPVLKEYFSIVNDDCETPLPDWIRTDIEAIQDSFNPESELIAWND